MYKKDLALDDLQGFICYKTKQTKPLQTYNGWYAVK